MFTGYDQLISWSAYCVDQVSTMLCARYDYVSNISLQSVLMWIGLILGMVGVILLILYIAFKFINGILTWIFKL